VILTNKHPFISSGRFSSRGSKHSKEVGHEDGKGFEKGWWKSIVG